MKVSIISCFTVFVWSLSSHLRIFHLYGDVTITGKGLQIFYLVLVFGSGAVTTCFYDLGLSRPGVEPRSPACELIAVPLPQ